MTTAWEVSFNLIGDNCGNKEIPTVLHELTYTRMLFAQLLHGYDHIKLLRGN